MFGNLCRSKQRLIARVAWLMTVAAIWPVSAAAATSFYVDPDWVGAQTGAAASPWISVTAAAWTVINTELANNDVTVYFSARAASADVDQTTTIPVFVSRTDTSSHRLTLDGNSQYNQNDGAPSWASYTGASRFQITANNPFMTAYAENSNITVRGFRVIATQGQIIYWWGGNNVIIEDNDGSSTSTVTYGPGIYFNYTQEEGTRCPTASGRESCTAWSNLIVRRNYVHDSYGEGIYIGGCANNPGCVSHDGVLIQGNTLRNIAFYGGEGDAIDLKDGLRHVVVSGNDIRLQQNSRDGVTMESGALVEKNYVEGAGRIAICFSAYWNKAAATRLGSEVRNNIVANIGGNVTGGYGGRAGIYVDGGDGTGDSFTDVGIYSNSIYKVVTPNGSGFGILVGAAGTKLKDNIVLEADLYPMSAGAGTLAEQGYNLFFKTGAGAVVANYGSSSYTASTITDFDASSLSEDPQFVSVATPYAPEHFRLQNTSRAIGRGFPVSTFSDDYFGTPRGSTWDMGAAQSGMRAPSPPSNVRVVR
jgi:hypothetical protein